ncbi:diacylglycerol kinase zeta isoform X6 [Silurus meridionalis]|nr:diacylglycerol kinase zeta isoform X6 [Silurus meridionalis]
MAEAGDCKREAPSQAAAPSREAAPSPADSVPVMIAPALEDVVEEEDVFLLQVSGVKTLTVAEGEHEDALVSPVMQLESEFLPLTIRKQVSYRGSALQWFHSYLKDRGLVPAQNATWKEKWWQGHGCSKLIVVYYKKAGTSGLIQKISCKLQKKLMLVLIERSLSGTVM